MAQLKDSVVQGSLRVTDTTYTNDLVVSTTTASRLIYTNSTKKLLSTTIASDGAYLSNISYLTVNTDHQTNYRLYVNGGIASTTTQFIINNTVNLAASDGHNGFSEEGQVGYTAYDGKDNGGRTFFAVEGIVNYNGSTSAGLYIRNYDGSTDRGWSGFLINKAKNGTVSYTVAAADAFRTAIGLGTAATYSDDRYIKTSASITTSGQLFGLYGIAPTHHSNDAAYNNHEFVLMTTKTGLFLWDRQGGDNGQGLTVWSSTKWVEKAGDTMTGALIVSLEKGTSNHITARAFGYTSSKNLDVQLMIGTGKENHGVYSTGYSTDGNAFTSSAKWLIHRDGSGDVILNNGGVTLTGAQASNWKVTINGTSSSSGTDTGALVVNGGVGIAGKLYVDSEIWTNTSLKVRPNSRYKNIYFIQNGTTNIAGRIEYDSGNATNITGGRFHFVQYSPNDPNDTGTNGKYEYYYFPTVSKNIQDSIAYAILTEKNTVTTAQGGTGNTSYTVSRLIYTNTATKLASTTIVSDGEYLSNISYLTINANHQTDYRLKVNGKIASTSSITLLGTEAGTATIGFSRPSVNYINIPTDGSLGFSINGSAGANVQVQVSSGCLSCYADKRSALGSSNVRWSTLYSGGGDFDSPVLISIGTHNGYGINGHRLALELEGDSHVSLMMKGGSVMYGFGVNTNGNWYFGKRTSGSFTDKTGDAYIYYGNDTLIAPQTTNNVDLGSSSKTWKNLYLGSNASIGGIVTISDTTAIDTSNYTTGALVVSGGASFAKDIIVNGWVRTFGSKGWYNQTNGGGWYMRASDYVRMYGNKRLVVSSNTVPTTSPKTAQLIVSSITYSGELDSAAGGNVGIELWRGTNASWMISNEGGTLYFKNNWTTALQTTYSQTAMTIAYNTGNTTIAGTLETGDNITIGTTSTSAERDLYVKSNSGTVAVYSTGGPNANGNRGLWFGAHGKGESITAVYADTDSNVWFNARGKGPLYLLKSVGEPWPYIRFDTAASYEGDSYTTTAQTGWGLLYCQVPAKKVSDNTYYSARFFFRVYSKTANTTTRTSHHETYSLPTATDGLSADASYNILTEKEAVTVGQGGTGVRSFTANSVIMSGSSTTSALTTRSLLNNTSVSHLGWSSSTGNGTYILTANSLAYWNGRYNSSSSNLTYCKNGEFGTIITANYPASDKNTVFLRGDGTWTSTLAATYVSNIDGARYIIRSTHGQSSSALVMFFGENADGTYQGIYSYGYRTSSTAALTSDAKYLVYRNSSGNVVLNGNASTASKLTDIGTSDAASSNSTWRNVWISYVDNTTGRPAYDTNFAYRSDSGILKFKEWCLLPYGGAYGTGGTAYIWYNGTSGVTQSGETANRVRCDKDFQATKVYNAVWNDYAECRTVETEEPGYCVTESSAGKMIKTYERLQAGCKITSDTFGTCMGQTEEAKTPIAVAGRVLVYPYRDRSKYKLGAAVCSAPGGTIDIMTRDEIMMYPERIVGTVSEIPTYEIWHGGDRDNPADIQVNGRIWIYVR